MTIDAILAEIRSRFSGLNPPATEADLTRLQARLGRFPDEVLSMYRDHDGSSKFLHNGDVCLPARLMPVDEVLKLHAAMAPYRENLATAGTIIWLWTDDNSNYLGLYNDGLLRGWLACVDHEEPNLAPVYRSAASFLERMLSSVPGLAPKSEAACDLPSVPREIPAVVDDPHQLAADRTLVTAFRNLYEREADDDTRRLYAKCAICLTPVADTAEVLSFLDDGDMWTPGSAVRLLELRRYKEGVEQLERLAVDGRPNGDSQAIRLLARMGTNPSKQAIVRLRHKLSGRKLQSLEQWTDFRNRLQPPRSP